MAIVYPEQSGYTGHSQGFSERTKHVPKLPEDEHFYPAATLVRVKLPEHYFWADDGSAEVATINEQQYEKARQYIETECAGVFPNARVYVHSSDDYGDSIEGLDDEEESWAYEYLGWIVDEALDLE